MPLLLALFFALGASQENLCGAEIKARDFPGLMVVQIKKTKIGIGSVAPFPGGSGHIQAMAGPLFEGAAPLHVKPEDFKIEPFFFPYLFSWRATLKASAEGRGEVRFSTSSQHASLSLRIPLEAKTRLGSVRFTAHFTTGRSPVAEIAGTAYHPQGRPLDLKTGSAALVATTKTDPESTWPFSQVDLYVRTKACVGLPR